MSGCPVSFVVCSFTAAASLSSKLASSLAAVSGASYVRERIYFQCLSGACLGK
jgi:hypothetical protein